MITQLNETNFNDNIKSGFKLVEFFAPWCGYCKQQERILNDMDNIWLGQVNSDDFPNLTQKFEILGFPTFILFKDGNEIERFSGLHSKFDIMNILMKYLK